MSLDYCSQFQVRIINMIFEKDCLKGQMALSFLDSSTAHSVDSQLFLLNHVDSAEMEQHCLAKLKAQRQRIEELVSTNERLGKELSSAKEQRRKMNEMMDALQEDASYRQFYEDLKEQFQKVLTSHEMADFEIEELKIELERTVNAGMEEMEGLNAQMRKEKEKSAIALAHLEGIMGDKEEQLRKLKRQFKTELERAKHEIEQLRNENQHLKEQLKQYNTHVQQNESLLKKQVYSKETDLHSALRNIEQLKKQVNSLKMDLSTITFEHQRECQEYLQAIEQSRTALRLLKREKEQLQSQKQAMQESVRNYQHKNKSLQETISSLKSNIQKLKHQSQSTLTRQSHSHQQQTAKLQATIQRLRKQVAAGVEEYNLLSVQCKRGKVVLEQRERHERQRRGRLMSEMRELEKIDKEIRKNQQ